MSSFHRLGAFILTRIPSPPQRFMAAATKGCEFVGLDEPELRPDRCVRAVKHQACASFGVAMGERQGQLASLRPSLDGRAFRPHRAHHRGDIVHPLVDRLFGDSIRKALAALVKNDDVRALCNRYRLAGNSRNSSTWQNGSGDENDVVGAVSKKIWTLPLLRIWFWNPCWSRSDRVNSAVVARLTQMFDSPSPVFTPSRKSASNYKARNINQERDINGKNASCSNLPIYAD